MQFEFLGIHKAIDFGRVRILQRFEDAPGDIGASHAGWQSAVRWQIVDRDCNFLRERRTGS